MILVNVTLAILSVSGAVVRVIRNPLVATHKGLPVIGPLHRRVLTVAEVIARDGISKNKAQALIRDNPEKCIIPYDKECWLALPAPVVETAVAA